MVLLMAASACCTNTQAKMFATDIRLSILSLQHLLKLALLMHLLNNVCAAYKLPFYVQLHGKQIRLLVACLDGRSMPLLLTVLRSQCV